MISVVIPTYRRCEDLAECLESIRANSRTSCEILILSPETNEELNRLCERYSARLHIDGSRRDGKRAKSLWQVINEGIELSSFDFACWLNDDCRVNKDWDAAALSYFSDDVGLVVLRAKGINGNPFYEVGPGYYGVPVANYGVIRKNTGIRFDERFNWFYGDADISLQMAACTSFKVVATRENLVEHLHKVDELRRQNEADLRAANDRRYFARKWTYKKRKGNRVLDMNILEKVYSWLFRLLREAYHALKRRRPR